MKTTLIIMLLACLLLFERTGVAHDRRADNQLNAARELYRLGKFEEAITKYKSALSHGPRGDVQCLLALCCVQKEQYQEAIQWLEKAKENQSLPHSAEPDLVHFWLGNCYLKLGKIDDAIKSYREATRVEPESVDYLQALAVAYKKAGREKEATESNKRITLLLAQQTKQNQKERTKQ